MERVWEELKRIEQEANYIRSDAKKKSEEIIAMAREDAEKLVSDARVLAEREAHELLSQYINEARREREEMLKRNEEKLKTYLKQNGAEWLIKETIPASSLRKWVKDIMEEQEEPVFNIEQRIPEDLRELVNVYLKPVVSIRKL